MGMKHTVGVRVLHHKRHVTPSVGGILLLYVDSHLVKCHLLKELHCELQSVGVSFSLKVIQRLEQVSFLTFGLRYIYLVSLLA